MPRQSITQLDFERAGEIAKSLFKEAVSGMAATGRTAGAAEPPRLFFPYGINHISVTVKAPGGIEVSINISGPDKPTTAAGLTETPA